MPTPAEQHSINAAFTAYCAGQPMLSDQYLTMFLTQAYPNIPAENLNGAKRGVKQWYSQEDFGAIVVQDQTMINFCSHNFPAPQEAKPAASTAPLTAKGSMGSRPKLSQDETQRVKAAFIAYCAGQPTLSDENIFLFLSQAFPGAPREYLDGLRKGKKGPYELGAFFQIVGAEPTLVSFCVYNFQPAPAEAKEVVDGLEKKAAMGF